MDSLDRQIHDLERIPAGMTPERGRSLGEALSRVPREHSLSGARTETAAEQLARRAQEHRLDPSLASEAQHEVQERLVRSVLQADPEGVEAAIADGAKVNGVQGLGEGPLAIAVRCAAETDDTRCLRILLRVPGVDVDVAGRRGETPLHEAAAAGSTVTAGLLLDAGANPLHRDYAGRTPLELMRVHQLAADERHPGLSRLLQNAEALRRGHVVSSPEREGLSHER